MLVLCDAPASSPRRTAWPATASFDHYLPHPDEFDPGRLAISVRLGLRLAGAAPAAAGAAPAAAERRTAAKAAPRPRPVLLMVEDDEFTHQLVAVDARESGRRPGVREPTAPARSIASARSGPTSC